MWYLLMSHIIPASWHLIPTTQLSLQELVEWSLKMSTVQKERDWSGKNSRCDLDNSFHVTCLLVTFQLGVNPHPLSFQRVKWYWWMECCLWMSLELVGLAWSDVSLTEVMWNKVAFWAVSQEVFDPRCVSPCFQSNNCKNGEWGDCSSQSHVISILHRRELTWNESEKPGSSWVTSVQWFCFFHLTKSQRGASFGHHWLLYWLEWFHWLLQWLEWCGSGSGCQNEEALATLTCSNPIPPPEPSDPPLVPHVSASSQLASPGTEQCLESQSGQVLILSTDLQIPVAWKTPFRLIHAWANRSEATWDVLWERSQNKVGRRMKPLELDDWLTF